MVCLKVPVGMRKITTLTIEETVRHGTIYQRFEFMTKTFMTKVQTQARASN